MKKIIKVLSFVFLSLFALTLVACAPKTAEDAKAKLEEKGYKVSISVKDEEEIGDDGVAATLTGTYNLASGIVGAITGDDVETAYVNAKLYTTSAKAKEAYDRVKGNSSENNPIKLVGKWVVTGDAKGVKDFQ